MTDLDKLIEAVELGDWVGQFDDDLNVKQYKYAAKAYHGSLDAAKALHEALLPNMNFAIEGGPSTYTSADVGEAVSHDEPLGNKVSWWHEDMPLGMNPARAWLLSILKAYRSLQ